MKILSAEEIRQWDKQTIEAQQIQSIELMECAAIACTNWLLQHFPAIPSYVILCGKGNNGGDGLAIARLLLEQNCIVHIYILEFGNLGTEDFQANLALLHKMPDTNIHFIQAANFFPTIIPGQVVIDALFGSGLNRPLQDVAAQLVNHINAVNNRVISIDLPSGMFADRSSNDNAVVKASHTLSFQIFKQAFLLPENETTVGEVHILDIGLDANYYESITTPFELVDASLAKSIHQPRNRFSHKGNFGHALLLAGSYGKIGAAVLSATGCLRSGVGLLTCHVPKCGYDILQTSVPEAMTLTDFNSSFITKIDEDLSKFTTIGIGPGIGTASETKTMLRELLQQTKTAMVIDADALNCIASQPDLLPLIPGGSVITPHPKEFQRLFGETTDDYQRIDLCLAKAKELNIVIVLKGHHTFIATPGGKGFFNNTGNAGMATGGSGDVLTGILTGLIAQGYGSIEAAILGVYLHGLAGDLAAKAISQEAMIAGDITQYLGAAFMQLAQPNT